MFFDLLSKKIGLGGTIKMNALRIGDLTISVPIFQGGMGVGVSLSGLASAVANEGGVGVISSAGIGLMYKKMSTDYFEACVIGLKKEIEKAREKTKGIIGVNIMVAMTNYADMVKTAIAEKVDIIISGAGMPLDLPKYREQFSTTKLIPIVSSSRAAKLICEKWKLLYDYLPDAIVVEGPKAGGHLGFKQEQLDDEQFSIQELIPQVCNEVKEFEKAYDTKIPVIAAGGIYTGEDIYNIMQLGASGVQIGTRFVTTEECDANVAFKEMYINAEEKDIEIIKSPVGMPGRAIHNDFLTKVKNGEKMPIDCKFHCLKTCDWTKSPYCIILALYSAYNGNLNAGYAFAGHNAFKATKIETVKNVFDSLQVEYSLVAKN